MANYNGSATTFVDLQTALQNACTTNGWTLNSGILSKNGCFFKLSNASNYLRLDGGTGQTATTLNGAHTYGAMIGSVTGYAITFPINYEIHIFNNPDEVYLVINYNGDFYQQLSFGKSDIPGIGGTGAWFTGHYRSDVNLTSATTRLASLSQQPYLAGLDTYYGMVAGGLFSTSSGGYGASFIHNGLDTVGWHSEGSSVGYTLGSCFAAGILHALPNLMNNANVLVPVKPVQFRNSNGVTIVANLKNARYLRIDNIQPGEIITFGTEKWKVYPYYRKDSSLRNGINQSTVFHSGTWGYAVRYTGA